MRAATLSWRDPAFYAYLLCGLLLLASSLACRVRAGHSAPAGPPAAAAHTLHLAGFTAPSLPAP